MESPTGPVIPADSLEPYEKVRRRAADWGILTQEDIDRVASSRKREDQPGEPEEYRSLDDQIFPGTRGFAVTLGYPDDHEYGGGMIDPAGHEGAYQVAAILTRRGAPNIPYFFVSDANMMEGDSHLILPEQPRDGDEVKVPFILYSGGEDEKTFFELVANQQGRLGQIRAMLRAENVDDARRKAYRLLNPLLCDLSYRYDVPVEILQINVAELTTVTLGGMKEEDFHEKLFDPEEFIGEGISYGELAHYEFFTRLYREGTNSSSMDYGFLCFFRLAEGIIELRRRAIIEQEGKLPEDVPRSSVLSDEEVVEGNEASGTFPAEQMGESLWTALKSLEGDRNKIGHAFLHSEDLFGPGHIDIITERLEGEERAGTRRARARYIARRLMDSMYFYSNETSESSDE
ncbi:MAG: hypothetical protein WA982_11685 [Rubrobacteraceae bacterium]